MGLSRSQLMKEFKLAAVQRLETAAMAEVARPFEINPNMLHRSRRVMVGGSGACPRRNTTP